MDTPNFVRGILLPSKRESVQEYLKSWACAAAVVVLGLLALNIFLQD